MPSSVRACPRASTSSCACAGSPAAAWSRTSPSTCTRARSWASPGSWAPAGPSSLRLIFGADRPDAGRVELAGRHVARPTPRAMRSDGRGLPARGSQAPRASSSTCRCAENLCLAALGRFAPVRPRPAAPERTLVGKLVRDLQVACAEPRGRRLAPLRRQPAEDRDRQVAERDPRVLILDEPTRGIDVQAKAADLPHPGRLAEAGVAVVFVSSELEEVMVVSPTASSTMAAGRIVRESVRREASLAEILLSATGAA